MCLLKDDSDHATRVNLALMRSRQRYNEIEEGARSDVFLQSRPDPCCSEQYCADKRQTSQRDMTSSLMRLACFTAAKEYYRQASDHDPSRQVSVSRLTSCCQRCPASRGMIHLASSLVGTISPDLARSSFVLAVELSSPEFLSTYRKIASFGMDLAHGTCIAMWFLAGGV